MRDLTGTTVILTRAVADNAPLEAVLRARGAAVLELPCVAVRPLADDRVRRERREAAALARDEDVARVLAFRDRGDHEVLALRRREILQGVDGDVDLAVRERALDRVDEDAVAERRDGRGRRIARRPDHPQLDGPIESVRDDPRLRESECAAAGPDDDAHGADTFRERATARNGCGEVCRNSGSLRP